MISAHVVQFETPKKVQLKGLWFGPKKAKNVIVWVHGLMGNAFSNGRIIEELLKKDISVLTFNNRGHDSVSSIVTRKGRKTYYSLGGAAHEVFVDCVDDILGAVRFAKKNGAKAIYVGGSSTGSQKSAYFASKKGKGIKGIILAAPISDSAGAKKSLGQEKINTAVKVANNLIHKSRLHEALSHESWPWPFLTDAQRFLSLYSGEGEEEIFTYWDAKRVPKILRSIKLPILVLLAERDEYADRPVKKIQDWFSEHIKAGDEITIIKKVNHGFKGGEKEVARTIRAWMKTV